MKVTPIGIIHSPHQRADGTPIQAAMATGAHGMVEVFAEYATGLRDLDGFERIWLVYWFDRAKLAQLVVTPYLDTTPRGLFATRAPSRPNPIGLSAVRLVGIVGNILKVEGLDMPSGQQQHIAPGDTRRQQKPKVQKCTPNPTTRRKSSGLG